MYWYIKALRQYADFNGRARRLELWMFHLVNIVVIIALLAAFIAVSPKEFQYIFDLDAISQGEFVVIDEGGYTGTDLNFMPAVVVAMIFVVYVFATIVPFLAVTVRRLHDIGRSGWWILISIVPSGIGNIVMLVFQVIDSDEGHNQYGANPKGIGNES